MALHTCPDTSSHDIYAPNRNFIVLTVWLPGGHVVMPWEKSMNYGSEGFVSAWRKMDRGISREREQQREISHFNKEWWRGNSEPSFPCLAPLAVAHGTFMLERFVIAPGLLKPWSLGIWRAPSFLHNYPLLWSLNHPNALSLHNDIVFKRVYSELRGVY